MYHTNIAPHAPNAAFLPRRISSGAVKQGIGYIRISADRTGHGGPGIDAQRRAIARFAAAEGCELIGEYIDEDTGTSRGARGRLPQLAAALALARETKAVVFVTDPCRPVRGVTFVLV
jgi:DNA invertase Pin-like site-specific DNA recombinase